MLKITACIALACAGTAAPLQYPRYFVVGKMYGSVIPNSWYQGDPASVTQASFDNITRALGNITGCDSVHLGVNWPLSLASTINASVSATFLANILSLAQANDVAVAIALDSFEWWEGLPQLWNWFDSSSPGYDPANVANVEWDGWPTDPSSNATSIAWRDWGAQFRVPTPHPNLASLAVQAAARAAIRPFAQQIAAWYAALPADRKYLLAAVKVGWEISIGTNFYYYPNGNQYRTQDPSGDPKAGISASTQLGYNSVCTAGIACEGAITQQQLDIVVSTYLGELAQEVHQAGIPRNRIQTHIGADLDDLPSSNVYNSPVAAFVPYAKPGFSVYRWAYNPADAPPFFGQALAALGGMPWGVSEWFYMGGNSGTAYQQWMQSITNSLAFYGNHMVIAYNWESLEFDEGAVQAVMATLSTEQCVVDVADSLAATPNGNASVVLTWTMPANADVLYLDVSALPYLTVSGTLTSPSVASGMNVTGSDTVTLPNLSPGQYFWTVRAYGCAGTAVPSDLTLATVSEIGAWVCVAAGASTTCS